MKIGSLFLALLFAVSSVDAYVPKSRKPAKPLVDLQKNAATAFVVGTLASSLLWQPLPADAMAVSPSITSSSQLVAEKVTREGVYREYESEAPVQAFDDARSTFKSAQETKSNKGKYTALLAVLIVGSFVIPMAQYFWYVRDDDSADKFFGRNVPEPEPPKKKGWF